MDASLTKKTWINRKKGSKRQIKKISVKKLKSTLLQILWENIEE